MKVFSQKVSALTFKLEGLNIEEVVNTSGAGWETLTFDFTGRTTGAAVTAITLIFDNGTAGDALNDPTNWTFLFDDIELTGGGGGAGGELAVNGDFETGDFTGWQVFLNSGTQSISSDTPDASSSSAALSGNTAVGLAGTTEIKQANLEAGALALGDVLNIQFDVKGTFGPGGQLNVLSFTEFGGGGANLSNNTTIVGGVDTWTHFDYNVTLDGPDASGGYSLAFNPVCGAVVGCFADVLIDNVSIVVVP